MVWSEYCSKFGTGAPELDGDFRCSGLRQHSQMEKTVVTQRTLDDSTSAYLCSSNRASLTFNPTDCSGLVFWRQCTSAYASLQERYGAPNQIVIWGTPYKMRYQAAPYQPVSAPQVIGFCHTTFQLSFSVFKVQFHLSDARPKANCMAVWVLSATAVFR